jgi:integrase
VLAICTGARRSELAALRWDDIDVAHRTAKIVRPLAFDEQGDLAEKSTKTGTERFVSLNVLALDTLRAHRANQAEERLRAGPAYEANDLIFADPVGRLWNPHSIYGAGFFDTRRYGTTPLLSSSKLR